MGLYLCIFDEADCEDIDGVDVGSYAAFGEFRDAVASQLERGAYGSRFPVLMLHPDGDGSWSVDACVKLGAELEVIATELRRLPPVTWRCEWQAAVANELNLHPANLYDCFIDVDGESLVARLQQLVQRAIREGRPVLFQ